MLLRLLYSLPFLSLALSLGMASMPANAGNPDETPPGLFMVGMGLSADFSNYDDAFPGGDLSRDDGIRAYAGLVPAEWFRLRAGLRTWGEQTVDGRGYEASLYVTGRFIDADLLAPVSERFLLGVTVGTTHWDAEQSLDIGVTTLTDLSGSDPYYGARMRISPPGERLSMELFVTRLTLRASALRRDVDITSLGVDLNVRF
jgi:hypothetical protein